MQNFRKITNHHLDVQVFDVDPSAARGPFVVVQEGCAPDDDTATIKIFILQQDGFWADIAYYLAGAGKNGIDQIVFPSMSAVMGLLYRMDSKVRIAPFSASPLEIAAWHLAHPGVGPGLEGLKRWASDFRRELEASY